MGYKSHSHDNLPACIHELGQLEFKAHWARFFLDIGTTDELSLDILINMLIGFSTDYVTILQIILGGDNIEWSKPNRKSHMQQIKETGITQDEMLDERGDRSKITPIKETNK